MSRVDRTRPVHFTELRRIGQSPAHYLAALAEPKAPTAAMRFGTLCHARILGGDVVVYHDARRGNAWKAFESEHAKRLIVTQEEYDLSGRVAEAVFADPVAAPLIAGGRHEVAVDWTMLGRARATFGIDVLGPDYVADLKTTSSVEPDQLRRAAQKMAYHAQLADYCEAARSLGEHPKMARIIGVETSPPFAVTVLRLTPGRLEAGAKLVRLWMERLLACEAADEWPAYTQSELDWDVDEGPLEVMIDGEMVAA